MSKADQQSAQAGAKTIQTNVATDTDNLSKGIQGQQDTAIGNAGTDRTATTDLTGTAGKAATDMATTGGYTDKDKTDFVNSATSGVKNTFDVLGQQAKLNAMRSGAASGPAAIAQIARQGGQDVATADTSARSTLNQNVNANKNTGISELNNTASVDKSLFDTDTNQITSSGQQLLQSMGLKYSTQEQAQALLADIANHTKGPLDNIEGAIGTAAKAGSAAAGLGWSPFS